MQVRKKKEQEQEEEMKRQSKEVRKLTAVLASLVVV